MGTATADCGATVVAIGYKRRGMDESGASQMPSQVGHWNTDVVRAPAIARALLSVHMHTRRR